MGNPSIVQDLPLFCRRELRWIYYRQVKVPLAKTVRWPRVHKVSIEMVYKYKVKTIASDIYVPNCIYYQLFGLILECMFLHQYLSLKQIYLSSYFLILYKKPIMLYQCVYKPIKQLNFLVKLY